ncbi:MAG: methyltransferase domain-containing protein [Anaerolineales bacterium]|nr:methyltransferase domain-containing protein [Anaerolineales bacterium]
MEPTEMTTTGDIDQVMKSQMERMVPTYDTYMRRMTLGREHVLRAETTRLAHITPGCSVLEVGCGTGTLTLAAKRQAGPTGQVFGIDVLPGMIEASRRKAAQAGEVITFQEGGIDRIPFGDGQFDVVLCSFMIFHMSEATRLRGIQEVHRVLKPSGQWLILDLALPQQPLQRFVAQRLFGGMLEHELRELPPLLERAGFSNVEMGAAAFRVMGLSVIGYVRGLAQKS